MKNSYVWVVTVENNDGEDFMICGVFIDYKDVIEYVENERKDNKVLKYTATQVKVQ